MQTVCFSPMAMLDAWSDGTKPWTFPEVEKAVQDVAMLRMQLLPYLYTSFAQYHFEGKPPFRAMNLVEGFGFAAGVEKGRVDAANNPYAVDKIAEIKDQYMTGDYLLVAPMFTGETKRNVYLPEGKWYDFYTGQFAGEHQVIEITPGLDRIPLFVKDGGIIPMIPAQRQAPGNGQSLPLEIRHYGKAEGRFVLYDDDGTTFNYERGEFSKTLLTESRNKKGRLQGNQPKPVNGKTWHYQPVVTWRFMTN
jgi:alpha-D-xyloside xylohydrolase